MRGPTKMPIDRAEVDARRVERPGGSAGNLRTRSANAARAGVPLAARSGPGNRTGYQKKKKGFYSLRPNYLCANYNPALYSTRNTVPPPTYDDLRLDQQLCFSLYAATNAITRAYREPLARLGLTYPQYLVLLVLWEGGLHTVKSLAVALELDSSTLTPLLKRLEVAGLVTRTRDTTDQRIVHIKATAEARALRRPVSAIQKDVGCRTELSNADIHGLRLRLRSLSGALTGTLTGAPDAPERG